MIREIICITFVLCVSAQESAAFNDKGRIVGGTLVHIIQRPFQVAVYIGGGSEVHLCGGSIISPHNVVTAAHCLVGHNASQVTVYAGSSNRTYDGILYNVSDIAIHPSYNRTELYDFDVAVLNVSSTFEYSKKIQPIKLITTRPAAGKKVFVSGWGSAHFGQPATTNLREVAVVIVDQETCRNEYRGTIITNNMICAGSTLGGKDACQGDSGGPLTYNGQLAAVVSFGNSCGQAKFPGVYASIAELRAWIMKKIG